MNAFAREVCGASLVRTAFDTGSAVPRLWWRAILWLHGKPVVSNPTNTKRVECLANGFAFYAALYRVLALLMLVVGACLFYARMYAPDVIAFYWCLAAFVTGMCLLAIAQIGTQAAKQYRTSAASGIPQLAVFFALLIGFLSLLLGGASVALHITAYVSVLVNIGTVAVVFALGIGSYLLELVYLFEEHGNQGARKEASDNRLTS